MVVIGAVLIVTNTIVTKSIYCQKECDCKPVEKTQEFATSVEIESSGAPQQYTESSDNVVEEPYTQEELDLLARVIYAEAGSDWISDEHQLAVGSIVLNRINDDRFPDDLYSVIYQDVPSIQYACTVNGMIYNEPDERTINNAKQLLTYGSAIPENIVWQSQVPQGNGIWKEIQGHYFCY